MSESVPRADLRGLTCLLADDNGALLEALESLLCAEGIEVLGAARTGVEALRLLERCEPSTIVLDLRLPDLGGIEVARRTGEIARKKPAVILYTSYADPALVTSALAAGARGVVLKDASPANLLEALSVVAAGGIYIDSRLRPVPSPDTR